MKGKLKYWIQAFRLRTLPLSLSVVLIGNALTLRFIESFNWTVFGLTLLTTVLLQILSNLANDYGDAVKGTDNDQRIGPQRAVQSGVITSKQMLNAIILFSILSFLSGIGLLLAAFGTEIRWELVGFFGLGLASIAAAIKYTMGKRAYGYAGLGDLFVFIFFGIVGVMGPAYLQMKSFNANNLLVAIAFGCFCVAVLNLNNMRDYSNDKRSGKKTLVVMLGHEQAKYYHISLFMLAYLSLILFFSTQIIMYVMAVAMIFPIIFFQIRILVLVYRNKKSKNYDKYLKQTALLTFVFSVLLSFFLFLFQGI